MSPEPLTNEPFVRSRRTKIVIAIVGVLVAVLAAAHATAMVMRQTRPPVALALFPNEPIALTSIGSAMTAAAAKDPLVLRQLRDPALRSLRGQAINPKALRLLAMSGAKSLEDGANETYLQLANRVSRRDLTTQILLLRAAALRGDVTRTLAIYDAILRTKVDQHSTFFPPMAQAVSSPAMRPYFRDYLLRNPPWMADFLTFASLQTNRPALYTDLLIETGGIERFANASTIRNRLIARHIEVDADYGRAAKVFLTAPGSRPETLRSPAVNEASSADPENWLMWQLYDSDSARAEILGNRVISATATGQEPVLIARKIVLLDPGSHVLEVSYEDLKLPQGARAAWRIMCLRTKAAGERELASVPIMSGAGSRLPFVSDQACPAVQVDLLMSGGMGREPSEVLATSLSLTSNREG